jgi:hypothetical protein
VTALPAVRFDPKSFTFLGPPLLRLKMLLSQIRWLKKRFSPLIEIKWYDIMASHQDFSQYEKIAMRSGIQNTQ